MILLTADLVCDTLNVSSSQLRAWMALGLPSHGRPGREVFDVDEVVAWLDGERCRGRSWPTCGVTPCCGLGTRRCACPD